jgi:hypothetical protein
MAKAVENGAAANASFDPVIDADSVLIAETLVPAHENPVTEDEYPEITPDDDELAI